ncbi:MAG TPA: DUF1343 domain-containing protein [Micromonosporaceae bacterium]
MRLVGTGAERACAQPERLGAGARARVGLVTNQTGVLPDLTPTLDGLRSAGVHVTALFGPEHGVRGTAQAGFSEASSVDPESGLPFFDTYRRTGSALDELIGQADVDVLVYDIQDIGCRCYTYVWTMADLMAAAARTGRAFTVLDRPNPISGLAVAGPPLDPAYSSFVGRAEIPLRHGLTVGELARWLARHLDLDLDLRVVPLVGWRRADWYDRIGLPWVPPSVNMPTLDTALVYSGTVLFEGTNLSEGRGTTRPFELIGAPYVDRRWAAALRRVDLPGVAFRDAWFTPAWGPHAGTPQRGVQVHITDRLTVLPVRTALVMLRLLRELYPDDFAWRPPERDGRRFVDLLWGSDRLRRTVDAGADPLDLLAAQPTDVTWAGDALLYD